MTVACYICERRHYDNMNIGTCDLCKGKGYVEADDIPYTPWKIDLQNALNFTADNFRVKLFQLLFKADIQNLMILRRAYPMEWTVWQIRQETSDDERFFKK